MTQSGRRSFFRTLARETASLSREVRGRPQYTLKDIPSLPEELVWGMIPVPIDSSQAAIQEGRLFARSASTNNFVEVWVFDGPELWILDRFDGSSPLSGIAEDFSLEYNVDAGTARQRVRRLFQTLAGMSLFRPADPLGEGDHGF